MYYSIMSQDEFFLQNWDDLECSPDLLRGIYAIGFENPSPIQQKAILPITKERHVVAQAQSGTGKTGAFVIGALTRVDLTVNSTQILIISPTKELTVQTESVVKNIGSMMTGLMVESVYGGCITQKNGNSFLNKKNPHIICGCPGKIHEMLRRRTLNPRSIKLVIVDEVDEMLSSSFNEQLYNIFQQLNTDVQVALFSATMPPHIHRIVDQIVQNPVHITVKTEMLTLEGIQQFFLGVDDDEQKYESLKRIFSYLSVSQCIIYCNSVKRVQDLYEAMLQDNFPVCCIHRNMTREERDKSFTEFKGGKSRVIISTNITARGIDIQQVSVVINFDVPTCVDNYLHRIGRSGRWGRKGVGINFTTYRDVDYLKKIEEHYRCNIKELPTNLSFLDKY